MIEELKPCPFCGGDAEITGAPEAGNNALIVCCCNCMACSAVIYAAGSDPQEKLIDLWNARQ